MSIRTIIKRRGKSLYAERDKKGRFSDITNIGKSIKSDRRKKSAKTVKKGYGHQGDLAKKKALRKKA